MTGTSENQGAVPCVVVILRAVYGAFLVLVSVFLAFFSVLGLEVQAFQIPIVVCVEGVIYVITLEHQVTFQQRKLALN